jgi:hypothetical protein
VSGANYPDWESLDVETPTFGFNLDTSSQTSAISGIQVFSPSVSTMGGVHLGSTVAELKSAYPTFTKVVSGYSTDLYFLSGSHGQLVFEVANAKIPGDWTAAQVGTVVFLSVWRLDAQPQSFANSDVSMGGCS